MTTFSKHVENILQQRFGRLVVESYLERRGYTHYWLCRCDCGKLKAIARANLGRNTFSCGCLKNENAGKRRKTHGLSKHPAFRLWTNLQQRCYNVKNPRYALYGGRGITIASRWRGVSGFMNFLKDMGERLFPRASLDRRDNNGPYSPENCRWASQRTQTRNSRNCRYITFNEQTRCLSEWAELYCISAGTLHARLARGQTFEQALTTPPRRYKKLENNHST